MKLPPGQTRWRLSLVALIFCTILCSSCVPSNNCPVISRLETEKDWVTPLSSSEVKCVASDPDGDSLTYTWSATGGAFSGAGPNTTWMAPGTPGTYTITVMVADSRGAEVTMQLTMDVRLNHPPVIESLTAESSVVEQARSTNIRCVAYDPDGDELSYLWTTTRGNISGQGSAVTWTAPNICGNHVVTVTVTDKSGGEVSERLEIKVTEPG